MAEYIEKQALLKKMYASHTVPLLMGHTTDEDVMFKTMVSIVEEQPSADVVEVKHGYWIKPTPVSQEYCSQCGLTPKMIFGILPCYCPHCGAKMDDKRKCDK